MKIRIPKEMYDKISDYALANDITFDEAILLCFKLGEAVEATSMEPSVIAMGSKQPWSPQYEPKIGRAHV